MSMTLKWSGTFGPNDLESMAVEFVEDLRQQIAPALMQEAEQIMTASRALVPVDDGILLGSADTVGLTLIDQPAHVEVVMGYGGAASAYAVTQHETPPGIYSHAPGKSWKYLEIPLMAAAEGLIARLAARIGGGGGSAP